MLIVTAATAVAVTAATAVAAAATVFLVLPSLLIGDRVCDDVDLTAAAIGFSDPCLLLIRFDSIRFDSIRFDSVYYEDITKRRCGRDDNHDVPMIC